MLCRYTRNTVSAQRPRARTVIQARPNPDINARPQQSHRGVKMKEYIWNHSMYLYSYMRAKSSVARTSTLRSSEQPGRRVRWLSSSPDSCRSNVGWTSHEAHTLLQTCCCAGAAADEIRALGLGKSDMCRAVSMCRTSAHEPVWNGLSWNELDATSTGRSISMSYATVHL